MAVLKYKDGNDEQKIIVCHAQISVGVVRVIWLAAQGIYFKLMLTLFLRQSA